MKGKRTLLPSPNFISKTLGTKLEPGAKDKLSQKALL